MFVVPLTTGGSKVAVGAVPVLVILLPINNTLIQNQALQTLFNYIIATLIGAALGWMAGDAFTHVSNVAKWVGTLGSLVCAVLANIARIVKASRDAGLHLDGSFLRELFVTPFLARAFVGSVQWATVAFVVCALAAIAYINTTTSTPPPTSPKPPTPPPTPPTP